MPICALPSCVARFIIGVKMDEKRLTNTDKFILRHKKGMIISLVLMVGLLMGLLLMIPELAYHNMALKSFIGINTVLSFLWAYIWLDGMRSEDRTVVLLIDELHEGWPEMIMFIAIGILGLIILFGVV